jgi:hypothetical protein
MSPGERVNRKILESLIQFDEVVELSVRLRVDAFVVSGRQRARCSRLRKVAYFLFYGVLFGSLLDHAKIGSREIGDFDDGK